MYTIADCINKSIYHNGKASVHTQTTLCHIWFQGFYFIVIGINGNIRYYDHIYQLLFKFLVIVHNTRINRWSDITQLMCAVLYKELCKNICNFYFVYGIRVMINNIVISLSCVLISKHHAIQTLRSNSMFILNEFNI